MVDLAFSEHVLQRGWFTDLESNRTGLAKPVGYYPDSVALRGPLPEFVDDVVHAFVPAAEYSLSWKSNVFFCVGDEPQTKLVSKLLTEILG